MLLSFGLFMKSQPSLDDFVEFAKKTGRGRTLSHNGSTQLRLFKLASGLSLPLFVSNQNLVIPRGAPDLNLDTKNGFHLRYVGSTSSVTNSVTPQFLGVMDRTVKVTHPPRSLTFRVGYQVNLADWEIRGMSVKYWVHSTQVPKLTGPKRVMPDGRFGFTWNPFENSDPIFSSGNYARKVDVESQYRGRIYHFNPKNQVTFSIEKDGPMPGNLANHLHKYVISDKVASPENVVLTGFEATHNPHRVDFRLNQTLDFPATLQNLTDIMRYPHPKSEQLYALTDLSYVVLKNH
jgi:hypothetical protein